MGYYFHIYRNNGKAIKLVTTITGSIENKREYTIKPHNNISNTDIQQLKTEAKSRE